jgi:hypothetical protein
LGKLLISPEKAEDRALTYLACEALGSIPRFAKEKRKSAFPTPPPQKKKKRENQEPAGDPQNAEGSVWVGALLLDHI